MTNVLPARYTVSGCCAENMPTVSEGFEHVITITTDEECAIVLKAWQEFQPEQCSDPKLVLAEIKCQLPRSAFVSKGDTPFTLAGVPLTPPALTTDKSLQFKDILSSMYSCLAKHSCIGTKRDLMSICRQFHKIDEYCGTLRAHHTVKSSVHAACIVQV
jgi:hypothetical protein